MSQPSTSTPPFYQQEHTNIHSQSNPVAKRCTTKSYEQPFPSGPNLQPALFATPSCLILETVMSIWTALMRYSGILIKSRSFVRTFCWDITQLRIHRTMVHRMMVLPPQLAPPTHSIVQKLSSTLFIIELVPPTRLAPPTPATHSKVQCQILLSST